MCNVFRSRRYNALARRLDTAAYDTEQLLLATLLFTVLAFLFPTVCAYYALASALRLLALAAPHAALDAMAHVLAEFPWLELGQRLTGRGRPPLGVRFRALGPSAAAAGGMRAACVELSLQHAPLALCFDRQRRALVGVASRHSVGGVLRRVFLGADGA